MFRLVGSTAAAVATATSSASSRAASSIPSVAVGTAALLKTSSASQPGNVVVLKNGHARSASSSASNTTVAVAPTSHRSTHSTPAASLSRTRQASAPVPANHTVRALASMATVTPSASPMPPPLPSASTMPRRDTSQSATDAFQRIPFHELQDPKARQQTMTTATNILLPFPIPQLIKQRLLLHKKCKELRHDIIVPSETTRELDEDTFLTFEGLLGDVRSALFSGHTGLKAAGEASITTLEDPTWGLDPAMGLVTEDEARAHLAQELEDMEDALVREINQLVVVGMMKRAKK
ncbi:hypothetical protein HDU96_002788 [Phlyctochytrium bullatum]|nr:hypothetical protein HDU96_002788 [Phlyctochytrium bullatum]